MNQESADKWMGMKKSFVKLTGTPTFDEGKRLTRWPAASVVPPWPDIFPTQPLCQPKLQVNPIIRGIVCWFDTPQEGFDYLQMSKTITWSGIITIYFPLSYPLSKILPRAILATIRPLKLLVAIRNHSLKLAITRCKKQPLFEISNHSLQKATTLCNKQPLVVFR